MREIYVFPRSGVWHAEMIGLDAESAGFETEAGAFGPVLPTPFTVQIGVDEVLSELGRLNPGVMVDWFETEAEWRQG